MKIVVLGISLLLTSLVGFLASLARAEPPLYLAQPNDLITVQDRANKVVLQAVPLDLPERRVPSPLPGEGLLKFRLLDRPAKLFEVDWRHVRKIELFEGRILARAKEFVAAGKLADARDHLDFLQRKYPALPGLEAALSEYLLAQAQEFHRKGQHDAALAMLQQLHQRNPSWPELEKAMGRIADKLIEDYLAKEEYACSRSIVRTLRAAYPQHPVAQKWESRWKEQAQLLLGRSKAAFEAGELAKADELCRKMAHAWPQLPGARALAEAIYRKYPRVVVGVYLPFPSQERSSLDDWAWRRGSRLVHRDLTRFLKPGEEGGVYECPVGELEIDAQRPRASLRLRPDLPWSEDAFVTGADVAGRLLAMADPRQRVYRSELAALLTGVSVKDVYRVEIDFRRRPLRPEALLQTILLPYSDPAKLDDRGRTVGPYRVLTRTEKETAYTIGERPATAEQPKQIAERRWSDSDHAIRALRQGRIQVLDRIVPRDIASAGRDPRIQVLPYALPLVHCLVPNRHRPLVANLLFRRALVYGIDREAILKELSGDQELPGAGVISGPFPIARDPWNQLGYAVDENLRPYPYDVRQAIGLVGAAIQEMAEGSGREEKETSLVLSHPAEPVARSACRRIAGQLAKLGLTVSLREQPESGSARPDSDVDLVYAQWAMWEPLVDARRLLDERGIIGQCSPLMALALHQVDAATSWESARTALRQVHRVAVAEMAVIPLWQMPDFFACHESVSGVGERPVWLYQNLSQWRSTFSYPDDEP